MKAMGSQIRHIASTNICLVGKGVFVCVGSISATLVLLNWLLIVIIVCLGAELAWS